MSQLLIYGEMKKYSELNRIVEVMVGESFIISLDSNPTTGYEWEVNFELNFIKHDEEKDRKFYRTSDEIGAGGKEEFEFQPLKSGKTEIIMRYKRVWEAEPIEKKVFNIEVKG